jgi:Rrf2 family protein
MLSRATAYALKALAYLAAQPPGKLAGAREIARSTGAPMPFLWKVLRNLRHRKLIRSAKGVHGGYELACPANRISVLDVIELTQRDNPTTRCVLGRGDCAAASPCILHDAWTPLREKMLSTLEQTMVADLAPKPKPRRFAKRPKGKLG